MTAFAIVTNLVITALIAVMFIAMPAMVRPTLPLGVSVPQSHADEPVVRSSKRMYRWGVAAAWVVGVGVSLLISPASPQLVLAIMPLLFVVLSAIVYVVTRRRIALAKREGAWFHGVATRIVADASPRRRGHPPVVWPVAAVLVVCATIAVGVAVYPSLPSLVPTHWNAAGQVDATATKSVWSVFTVQLITLGVVALFHGLSWLAIGAPARRVASDTAEQAARRAEAQRQLTSTGLGMMSLAVSIGLGFTTIVGWLAPHSGVMMGIAVGVTLVLLLGTVAMVLVRYGHTMSRANTVPDAAQSPAAVPGRPRAEAPDDDRYWKLGALYVNRDDPATFVPKRFGVGWTINLGSPGGIAFAVVTVLIVVGAIVTSTVVSR